MDIINNSIKEHIETTKSLYSLQKKIKLFSNLIIERIKNKKNIYIMGNGGSAADSQHFVGELVWKYKKNRKAISAIALSTNTSVLTAISNDNSFDEVFERQIEAFAKEGDLIIAVSTSGNSKNINNAIKKAKKIGCFTVGLSGNDGGLLKNLVNLYIIIPSSNVPRIQEAHMLIFHLVCEMIDEVLDNERL